MSAFFSLKLYYFPATWIFLVVTVSEEIDNKIFIGFIAVAIEDGVEHRIGEGIHIHEVIIARGMVSNKIVELLWS